MPPRTKYPLGANPWTCDATLARSSGRRSRTPIPRSVVARISTRPDPAQAFQPRTPVLGIVLEMQFSTDEDKRYAWPVYAANLRARIRCPVCLLVITA